MDISGVNDMNKDELARALKKYPDYSKLSLNAIKKLGTTKELRVLLKNLTKLLEFKYRSFICLLNLKNFFYSILLNAA